MLPFALTVGGLDPSGAAGVLMDTKVFQHFGVPSAAVITANTVQNTCGAKYWEPTGEKIFRDQLEAIKEDLPVGVIKVGMLARGGFLKILVETFGDIPLIVDPVMSSKNGKPLVDDPKVYLTFAEKIFLITPNLPEARFLTGSASDDALELAKKLQGLGFRNVLVKGGHAGEERVRDLLLTEGGKVLVFSRPRVGKRPRGTGCALSSAIAANYLIFQEIEKAALRAEEFVGEAIKSAQKLGRCHEVLLF
jgi:hydroxymethylpyrimidine/phosphomethylpyrimidine kinase